MGDGRTARSERTRARILDATLTMIIREGADAVTQRRVAAAAGTSLASTTYHFPTAEDLLVAAFEAAARRSAEEFAALAARVEDGSTSLIDAALAFAGRAPEGEDLAPDAIPQLMLAAVHHPRLRAASQAYVDRLAAGMSALPLSPEAAGTLVRALTGIILHEMERGGPRPSAALREDLSRLFIAFGAMEPPGPSSADTTPPGIGDLP